MKLAKLSFIILISLFALFAGCTNVAVLPTTSNESFVFAQAISITNSSNIVLPAQNKSYTMHINVQTNETSYITLYEQSTSSNLTNKVFFINTNRTKDTSITGYFNATINSANKQLFNVESDANIDIITKPNTQYALVITNAKSDDKMSANVIITLTS